MAYPKHEGNNGAKRPRKKAAEQAVQTEPDNIGSYGLLEIAEQLSKIQHSLKSYNVNACDGEMSFNIGLSTWQNHSPVRLVLEGAAVDSIAESLKRIANAMTPKPV